MFATGLPESIIKGLSIRAKELGAVNLGQGIPSFPTPDHIIAAARHALDDGAIGIYPNFLGEIELREKIAEKLNRQYNLSLVGQTQVLVTVGAMEATASAILSLVENGNPVGVISPDYCNHFPQVHLARGTLVEIPLVEKKRWELDFDAIRSFADRSDGPRLLILTSPSNPTGAVFSRKSLNQLVTIAQARNIWLLSDETYSFLTYDTPFVSLLEYQKLYKNILVVRSFSKEYAMTGWRVGYLVGEPSAVKEISKVHDALIGCAPKISQRAALAALSGPQDIVETYRKTFARRREIVRSTVAKNDATKRSLAYCEPEGAYYAFLRYRAKIDSVTLSERLLTEAKVAVVPGAAFGRAGEGHMRISFAVEDDILREGLVRISKYINSGFTERHV